MKKIFIILVVAAIVIVSGIYIVYNEPVNKTPEDTYITFHQKVNDGDGVGATELTIWKFSSQDDYDETVEFYDDMGLFYQIETHEMTVIHSHEMDQDYELVMQNTTQNYENDFNITIEDYCYINMSRTVNYYSGETEYLGFSNVGCLQVDGRWYLCRFDYYGTEQP